jgi:hypothetical protein
MANHHALVVMRSPFVDSASFLSEGPREDRHRAAVLGIRLLAFALVMAVAASSAVLLAM